MQSEEWCDTGSERENGMCSNGACALRVLKWVL